MWCISQPPLDPAGLSCTVPVQCCVPSVRTEVVVRATVALPADRSSVRRLSTVMKRSAAKMFWKL